MPRTTHSLDQARLSQAFRAGPARRRQSVRLAIELLGERVVPATYSVTTTADAGAGSLRQAILDANANTGPDDIAFNIGGGGVQTIQPASALPEVTDPVVIDGTTQSGFAGMPVVVLNGSQAGSGVHGLAISAGSSTVRGLAINAFDGHGIVLQTNGGNVVAGNFIGTNAAGTGAVGNLAGVFIASTSSDNTVGGTAAGDRNLISGNRGSGVAVDGGTANRVQGNFIGTDVTGGVAIGNRQNGVDVGPAATEVTVGGTAAGAGNVISGSLGDGVAIRGIFPPTGVSTGNVVAGNRIGTNATGTSALPNAMGVSIANSSGNTIGGTTAEARNLISGNTFHGITITGPANTVQGNFIGTGVTGTTALGNGRAGVLVTQTTGIRIGGTAAGAGNLISGNGQTGVALSFGSGHVVQGNIIGADVTGSAPLGNLFAGVGMGQSSDNTIGGTEAGARNIISGNGMEGVTISIGSRNLVQGNFIGTDATGTAAVGNGLQGVSISGPDSTGNTVGGTAAGAGNLISGNTRDGVFVASSSNLVAGNTIGTNAAGTAALGNGRDGVHLSGTGEGNTIGGTTADARNLISGNVGHGIHINSRYGQVVQGNYVGTDATGDAALGNGGAGVKAVGGSNNTIGGTAPGAGNLISGNQGDGVFLSFESPGGSPTGNVLQGNRIGTDATGARALGNGGHGVAIDRGADNTVGGTAAGAGNLISGNQLSGVYFEIGARNLVAGNHIGTDAAGTAGLANRRHGVEVLGTSLGHTIGGTASGAGNLISGNLLDGVFLGIASNGGTADNNVVQGNRIGTDVTGALALGNGGAGVLVQGESATGNRIRGNAIHSNGGLGIDLGGDGVTANDADDADAGPNGLQNFPALFAAHSAGGVRVYGPLTSAADTTYTLDFFASPTADPTGYGEGARYLGSTTVTTNAAGNAWFHEALPAAIAAGEVVSATATAAGGGSSEFSPAVVPATEVAIDVRPGDPGNVVDPTSTGTLTVAVLTTLAFDAATVDASDLSAIRFGDPTGPASVSPQGTTLADVDLDGDTDRVFLFSVAAIAQAGALSEASAQAQLTGRTLAGLPIGGVDAVTVTDVNHVPVVTTNAGLTADRGQATVVTAAALTATDPNGDPITYTITAGPTHGALVVNGSPAATFTQADVDAGRVAYRHDGSPASPDAFTFTVGDGLLTSDPATIQIAVREVPLVTLHPAAQVAFAGTFVTFTAAAEDSQTVQWQVSTNGGQSFQNVPGATTPTLTFKVEAAHGGNLYRAVFANATGPAASSAATLTINPGLVLVSDPAAQTVPVGTTATFTAVATGTSRVRVQWQVSQDGGATFSSIPGAVGAKLRVRALATADGNLYRAVLTNRAGTAVTTAAGLTVDYRVAVAGLGRRVSVPVGTTMAMTGSVRGMTTPTVQWEVSVDKGRTYTAVPGATAATLTLTAAAADNGARYRAVFTEGTKVRRTGPVTLAVGDRPAVTTPPADVTVVAGGAATFSLAVAGTLPVKVQWQVSTDGGRTYANVRAAVRPALTLRNVKPTSNGNLYRAVVTNAFDQIVSPAARLTVT